MVKVRIDEFLSSLCVDLNYRLFSGVPTKTLKVLYDNMSSEFMHYIPAIDEIIALGIISGAFISGYKGAVILGNNRLNVVENQLNMFNLYNHIPTLFITDGDVSIDLPVWRLSGGLEELVDINKYINIDNSGSGVLIIDDGVLYV